MRFGNSSEARGSWQANQHSITAIVAPTTSKNRAGAANRYAKGWIGITPILYDGTRSGTTEIWWVCKPSTGYASRFAVTFTGGGGSGAAGTATAIGGAVVSVDITNPGSGYTSAPTPNLSAGGGTGAAGTAVLTALRLDAIPTVNLPAGLIVFFALSTAVKIYVLTAGTDAEASPNVIRPDDYAAGSNEKVWKLATVG